MIVSKFRGRVLGLFQARPKGVFRILEIENTLKDVKKPVINYWLKQFLKEELILKPKYGHYMLNPNPPDMEAIRAQVLAAGKARVVDTGRGWKAGEEALQVLDEHPAMQNKRLHFMSILERMKANPSFSSYDVELLVMEAKHLVKIKEPMNG